MSNKGINKTCPKCKAVTSYEPVKGIFGVSAKCKKCGNKMTPQELQEHRYNFISANPRCPNTECDFHKEAPPAKFAFVISVVEEGLMGKIFKSEAYGIVSCKLCGEVVGVGGKG